MRPAEILISSSHPPLALHRARYPLDDDYDGDDGDDVAKLEFDVSE